MCTSCRGSKTILIHSGRDAPMRKANLQKWETNCARCLNSSALHERVLYALASVEERRACVIKHTAIAVGLRTGGWHHARWYRAAAGGLGRLAADGVVLHRAKCGFTSDAYRRARPRFETGRIADNDSDRVRAACRVGVGKGGRLHERLARGHARHRYGENLLIAPRNRIGQLPIFRVARLYRPCAGNVQSK